MTTHVPKCKFESMIRYSDFLKTPDPFYLLPTLTNKSINLIDNKNNQ